MNEDRAKNYSMPIRMYGKTELAQYYFPDSPAELARDHLSRWIRKHPKLREEVQAHSIGKQVEHYTSLQVEAIFYYLGDP
jgi:hypothetical protein